MALPIVALERSSVVIGGQTVEFRALSRAEAMQLNEYKGREDEAELLILQWGTGCSEEDARAFREGNDVETSSPLIDGILILSKLAEADLSSDPKRGGRPSVDGGRARPVRLRAG